MGIRKIGRRLAASAAATSLAATATLGAGAGPAHATALGPWRQVANSGLQNISEAGLARTPDGVLHVAWASQQTPNSEGIFTLPIAANGSVGGTQTVTSGWASLEDPALGLTPSGGLQAFFGGIQTTVTGAPNSDMNLETSTDGGNTWSLLTADVIAGPDDTAYASQTAVSNSLIGQASPFETWTGTSGVWVNAGIAGTTPDSNYQAQLGGCCGYYSSLASDAAGNTELAWYSNATGKLGIWAQGVAAGGSPIGSPLQMPGTANLGVGELQKTPLVARPQGGFYVVYPIGYPSFTGVELWKVGGGAIKVGGAAALNPTTASAAVDQAGRVWVFWSRMVNDKPMLFATRSNPSVTRFGAVVAVGAPSKTGSTYALDGNAANGALDVVTTLNQTGSSQISIWTRHVYPGLSLGLSPASGRLHHAVSVTASVTDAGVPVKGASVTLGGHTATTNAGGKATIHLQVSGTTTARASRAGYVSASAALTARR